MLTELQKSLTSFNSFKNNVSLWSRPRWNNAGGDQHCPRGNRSAYTNVAKFQASTRDPWDKSSASSTWHPQDKPPRSSHPCSSRSESGETSEKGCREEKEKQRYLKHERANVNVPNVANTGPSQGRTETPQKTSDSLGNLRVDETNMDGQIPCIWKVNAIHSTFAKELRLWSLVCLLTSGHRKSTATRWISIEW